MEEFGYRGIILIILRVVGLKLMYKKYKNNRLVYESLLFHIYIIYIIQTIYNGNFFVLLIILIV